MFRGRGSRGSTPGFHRLPRWGRGRVRPSIQGDPHGGYRPSHRREHRSDRRLAPRRNAAHGDSPGWSGAEPWGSPPMNTPPQRGGRRQPVNTHTMVYVPVRPFRARRMFRGRGPRGSTPDWKAVVVHRRQGSPSPTPLQPPVSNHARWGGWGEEVSHDFSAVCSHPEDRLRHVRDPEFVERIIAKLRPEPVFKMRVRILSCRP